MIARHKLNSKSVRSIVFVMLLTGLLPITDFSWCTSIVQEERWRETETVIYRAENVTGIAWHLLGVRKTEEKQTRRLSRVVPLKGGLLMSVAFFRPPNHRVPEGSVDAHPTSTSPVEVFRNVSATLRLEQFPGATESRASIASFAPRPKTRTLFAGLWRATFDELTCNSSLSSFFFLKLNLMFYISKNNTCVKWKRMIMNILY